MSNSRTVTLQAITGRVAMLEIECAGDLGEVIAHGCPRLSAASIYDRCGVHYPELPAVFLQPGRSEITIWEECKGLLLVEAPGWFSRVDSGRAAKRRA